MIHSYKQEDFDRMRHIEDEVAKRLLEFKDNTEAALVVFALIRIAKRMLALYPDATRAELTEVIVMTLLDAKETTKPKPRKSVFDLLFDDPTTRKN